MVYLFMFAAGSVPKAQNGWETQTAQKQKLVQNVSSQPLKNKEWRVHNSASTSALACKAPYRLGHTYCTQPLSQRIISLKLRQLLPHL